MRQLYYPVGFFRELVWYYRFTETARDARHLARQRAHWCKSRRVERVVAYRGPNRADPYIRVAPSRCILDRTHRGVCAYARDSFASMGRVVE